MVNGKNILWRTSRSFSYKWQNNFFANGKSIYWIASREFCGKNQRHTPKTSKVLSIERQPYSLIKCRTILRKTSSLNVKLLSGKRQ